MKSATRRQLDEAGVTDAIGAEHFIPRSGPRSAPARRTARPPEGTIILTG